MVENFKKPETGNLQRDNKKKVNHLQLIVKQYFPFLNHY